MNFLISGRFCMRSRCSMNLGNASEATLFDLLRVLGGFKEDEVSNAWGISAQEFLVSKVVIHRLIDLDTLLSNTFPSVTWSEHEREPIHEFLVHDDLNSVAIGFVLRGSTKHLRSSFHGDVLLDSNSLRKSGVTIDEMRQVDKSQLVISLPVFKLAGTNLEWPPFVSNAAVV